MASAWQGELPRQHLTANGFGRTSLFDQRQDSTEAHQGRLASVRAESQPMLPAGSVPSRAGSTHPPATLASDASGEQPRMHHTQKGDVMSECILENRSSNIRDNLREAMRGWHKRSCAALIN